MANLTPLKAIRAKCIDCSGGNLKEVRYCTVESCSLYPYRMGKRPTRDNSSTTTVSSKNSELARGFSANKGIVLGEVIA